MLDNRIIPTTDKRAREMLENSLAEIANTEYSKFFYSVPGNPVTDNRSFSAKKWRYLLVDDDGVELGYITVSFEVRTNSITNFGFINFRDGNALFFELLVSFIKYCLEDKKIQRIEFKCITNSPYFGFMYKLGNGVLDVCDVKFLTVGTLHRARRLRDLKLYDTTIFEFIKDI